MRDFCFWTITTTYCLKFCLICEKSSCKSKTSVFKNAKDDFQVKKKTVINKDNIRFIFWKFTAKHRCHISCLFSTSPKIIKYGLSVKIVISDQNTEKINSYRTPITKCKQKTLKPTRNEQISCRIGTYQRIFLNGNSWYV